MTFLSIQYQNIIFNRYLLIRNNQYNTFINKISKTIYNRYSLIRNDSLISYIQEMINITFYQ